MLYLADIENLGNIERLHLQASWGVAAPKRATKLAVLMMLPPVWSPLARSTGLFRMAWIAYLQPHQTPFRLTCIVKSLQMT